MIKLEHTLFSLPFVIISALLSVRYEQSLNPEFKPEFMVFVWIFLCLLGARSAGMTLNRIIDAGLDSLNPRTKDREIPAGKISVNSSWIFSLLGILLLIFMLDLSNCLAKLSYVHQFVSCLSKFTVKMSFV